LGTEVKVYSQNELDNLKNKKYLNGKVIFNGFIYNKRRIAEVILDFVIISISYISAFLLRFEGLLFSLNVSLILESLPVILIIKFLSFYFFGLYRGVWRYIGLYDIIAIFKAVTVGSVLSIVTLLFLFRFRHYSRTVFIIDWLLTLISASGVRILFRLYKEFFANIRLGGRRILIFGAGDAGEMTLREIRQNGSLGYKPIGFVDDDEDKFDRLIHGVRVLGRGDNLEKLIYRHKIEEVLIALPLKTRKRRLEVQEICKKMDIPFKEVSKMLPVEKEGV
jgi:UDP-GlcNAc:undecaprenyl-phosphate GlcNAc-1-phosphate transferase